MFSPTLLELSLWLVLNAFVYRGKKITYRAGFQNMHVNLRIVEAEKPICPTTRPPQHKILMLLYIGLNFIFPFMNVSIKILTGGGLLEVLLHR